MEIQFSTILYIIIIEIVLAFTILKMLKYNNTEAKTMKIYFAIFSIWLVVVLLLFGNNSILATDISSLTLFIVILIGVGLVGLILLFFL